MIKTLTPIQSTTTSQNGNPLKTNKHTTTQQQFKKTQKNNNTFTMSPPAPNPTTNNNNNNNILNIPMFTPSTPLTPTTPPNPKNHLCPTHTTPHCATSPLNPPAPQNLPNTNNQSPLSQSPQSPPQSKNPFNLTQLLQDLEQTLGTPKHQNPPEKDASTKFEEQITSLRQALQESGGGSSRREELERIIEEVRILRGGGGGGGGKLVGENGDDEVEELMRVGGWGEEERKGLERSLGGTEGLVGGLLEKEWGVEGGGGEGRYDVEGDLWEKVAGVGKGGRKGVRVRVEDMRRVKERVGKRRRGGIGGGEEVGLFDGVVENAYRDLLTRPFCPGCNEVRTRVVEGQVGMEGVVELCPNCKINESITPLDLSGGRVYEPGSYMAWKSAEEGKVEAEQVAKAALDVTEQFAMERAAARAEKYSSVKNVGDTTATTVKARTIDDGRSTSLKSHRDHGNGNGHGDGVDDNGGANGRSNGSNRARWKEWHVEASNRSLRTINPIRNLVQNMSVKPNPEKKEIKLSIGDPTVYGNLKVNSSIVEEYQKIIRGGKSNGYSPSFGEEAARRAIVEQFGRHDAPLNVDDVVLASGTSGAIEMALGAIANAGDNILVPSPGFPLFCTIAEYFGIECRQYTMHADQQWEINLNDVGRLADERTAALIINNPSNPCGSVYSKQHLEDVVSICSSLCLPIISDEVYADMVFSDVQFTPIASVSSDVPILTVGSISKLFVVPGWRLGWIMIHDRNNIFENGGIRRGIKRLTTRMLVPNTPAQRLLPKMLKNYSSSVDKLMGELEEKAGFAMENLEKMKGITCVKPQGSMYLMAKVDVGLLGVEDDRMFVEELYREESVFLLPGSCFGARNFVRVVFCAPKFVLSEAFHRMRAFCARRSGGM